MRPIPPKGAEKPRTSNVMRGFIFTLCLLIPAALYGQDSLRVEQLSESVVSAVRARENAPYAVVNLRKAELSDFSTTGMNSPGLTLTPSGVFNLSNVSKPLSFFSLILN